MELFVESVRICCYTEVINHTGVAVIVYDRYPGNDLSATGTIRLVDGKVKRKKNENCKGWLEDFRKVFYIDQYYRPKEGIHYLKAVIGYYAHELIRKLMKACMQTDCASKVIGFIFLAFLSAAASAAELKITVTDPSTGKTVSEYEKSYTPEERTHLRQTGKTRPTGCEITDYNQYERSSGGLHVTPGLVTGGESFRPKDSRG